MLGIMFVTETVLAVSRTLGLEPFEVRGFLAVFLTAVTCGCVGSMVVGNRMAFFSDAMAHCSFAGVALGLLIVLLAGFDLAASQVQDWLVPLVMVAFSAGIGVGVALVREQTGLASDTVIGVFFAAAMGFGAVLLTALGKRGRFDPEAFLFGNPWVASDVDLVYLALVLGVTLVLLGTQYSAFVLGSVNAPLARSRGVSYRWRQVGFIILLALVVNFALRAVGVLLINGLLIVPAAAAANVSRSLKGMFGWTLAISVGAGVGGLLLSTVLKLPLGNDVLEFGPSGPILLLCVGAFAVSMAVALGRRLAGNSAPCDHEPGEPGCLH